MKHLAIAVLAYLLAVVDTFPLQTAVRPDCLLLLAAVLIAWLPVGQAMAWAAVLGLLADGLGPTPPGTLLLIYAGSVFVVRSLLSDLTDRGFATLSLGVGLFVFLASAVGGLVAVRRHGASAALFQTVLQTCVVTWLCAAGVILVCGTTAWVWRRLRGPEATGGGAVGTPVGLSVR